MISTSWAVYKCSCTEFLPSQERPTYCALQTCQHIRGTHNNPSHVIPEFDDDVVLLFENPRLKKVG